MWLASIPWDTRASMHSSTEHSRTHRPQRLAQPRRHVHPHRARPSARHLPRRRRPPLVRIIGGGRGVGVGPRSRLRGSILMGNPVLYHHHHDKTRPSPTSQQHEDCVTRRVITSSRLPTTSPRLRDSDDAESPFHGVQKTTTDLVWF